MEECMKYISFNSIAFCLALVVPITFAVPCTTFSLNVKGKKCFGKNYDFPVGYGHVSVNKRNLIKVSIPLGTEKRCAWVSKYGSITFNQFGKELPCGGMNETGLVIELMAHGETVFPNPDARFGLTELQWIQYMLDNFASVDEVISSDNSIRMSVNSMMPIHVLISDKSGNTATLEYLNNKTVIHKNWMLPVPVLTNDTYDQSVNYYKRFCHVGDPDRLPQTVSSLDRFTRAAWYIHNYRSRYEPVEYSFSVLSSTNVEQFTQWSIVYDIQNMSIYYKTLNNNTTRMISMKDFDLSSKTPALYIDIDADINNTATDFLPYSQTANSNLIETVFSSLDGFRDVPAEALSELSRYPDTVVPLPIE
jgi:choloylglycine hydrolase